MKSIDKDSKEYAERFEQLSNFQKQIAAINPRIVYSGSGSEANYIGEFIRKTDFGDKIKEVGIRFNYTDFNCVFYFVYPDSDPDDGWPGFYLVQFDEIVPKLDSEYQKLISFNINLYKYPR